MPDPQAPSGSIRLGRVAGVPVYLDRTWLILGAFIAWTGWQAGRDLGTTTGIAYAGWLVLGILTAVLGHEIAHAVAGRMLGFRVHRIVATLWGGHTSYDGTGSTPGRAAAIAVSGPLANLGLAGIGWIGLQALTGPVAQFVLWWFVAINLLLAAFNLLPGLPLDGGQVVHSLVWKVSGRRDTALLVAGWLGRLLAVMAWVLWSGATAALRRAPFERLLDRLDAEEVIEPVGIVRADTPVGHLVGADRRLLALDDRGVPILLVPTASADAPDLTTLDPATPVSSLLVRLPDTSLIELAPGASVEPLLRAMALSGNGVVVVVSNGAVRGLVTADRLNAVAERHLRRN